MVEALFAVTIAYLAIKYQDVIPAEWIFVGVVGGGALHGLLS